MKKLLVLFALIAFFNVAGFSQVEFGAKAGPTFASVGGDDAAGTEGLTTFHIGLTGRTAISDQTYFDAGLLYTGAGFKLDNSEFDFEPAYIIAPLTVRYYATEQLNLFGGLQPAFVVNDDDAENLESFEAGLPVGLAYDFVSNISAEASYTLGLTDISSAGDLKNRAFRLSFAYRFE